MNSGNEPQRSYFEKASSILPELFQTAFVICGEAELAEYCLQYAMTQHYAEGSRKGMSFHEGLRSELRKVSLEEAFAAKSNVSEAHTWDGLSYGGEDPVMVILAAEEQDVRRAVALVCGCGLSVVRTAQLMDLSQSQVRRMVDRVRLSVERTLDLPDERRARQRLTSSVRRALAREDAAMPSRNALYRAFVSEISEEKPSRHVIKRAVRALFAAAMIAVCVFLVWLAAVLIQPDTVELMEMEPSVQEQR